VTRRGWTIAGEYVDVFRGDRKTPEFTRLISDVRQGQIDVLVVEALGQLGRSLAEIVTFIEDLRVRGIGVVAVRDGIDTTSPCGEAILETIRALARAQRELAGEKARAAIEAARRRGAQIGRPRVCVDIDRALALRGQGKSLREIARVLRVGASTLHRALKSTSAPRMAVAA
jgi:DNA invertase Pin-like site-specific DNA recombinase